MRYAIPWISLTKDVQGSPVPATSGTQGNFDVRYRIRIDNDGSTSLDSLSLIEDMRQHFGDAYVGLVSSPTIVGGTATTAPTINATYDGTSTSAQLIEPTAPNLLEPGQYVELELIVEVDPDAPGRILDSVSGDGNGDFESQAVVSGNDTGSLQVVTDFSDDTTDPTDVDGDPANPANTSDDDNDPDDPTAIWLPSITLTKTQIGAITPAISGTAGNFDVAYDLTLTNNGNEPLQTLSLIEDLEAQFGSAFVRVIPQSGLPAQVIASTGG